jgi:hypothetical protein
MYKRVFLQVGFRLTKVRRVRILVMKPTLQCHRSMRLKCIVCWSLLPSALYVVGHDDHNIRRLWMQALGCGFCGM